MPGYICPGFSLFLFPINPSLNEGHFLYSSKTTGSIQQKPFMDERASSVSRKLLNEQRRSAERKKGWVSSLLSKSYRFTWLQIFNRRLEDIFHSYQRYHSIQTGILMPMRNNMDQVIRNYLLGHRLFFSPCESFFMCKGRADLRHQKLNQLTVSSVPLPEEIIWTEMLLQYFVALACWEDVLNIQKLKLAELERI